MNYPCLRFTKTKKGSFQNLQSWTDVLGSFQILHFSQKDWMLRRKAMTRERAWKLNRETSSYWHCVRASTFRSTHLDVHWTTRVHKPLFRFAHRLSIFVKREKWWVVREGEGRNCPEALVSSNIVLLFFTNCFLASLTLSLFFGVLDCRLSGQPLLKQN